MVKLFSVFLFIMKVMKNLWKKRKKKFYISDVKIPRHLIAYFLFYQSIQPSFRDTLNGGCHNTREVLSKFGVSATEDDIAIVQYVCEVVSNRGALLVSICE